ncbi:hypothetical protein LTR62_007989 [Meristemomyces frigidus]|uniref:Epoxide hydrolase N-terminal domain-containing protein n=1 Tax=Meristemomyces frigidus TaxID=1508187 RepID=A0AAN7YIQ8_9PEZI|nr:hypothetical protein LTR62_007989 [Meristemomyces frigidus]
MSYTTLPTTATLHPQPFIAHVPDTELHDLKQALKYSRLGPPTYENLTADPKNFLGWGLNRSWLAEAKQHWETEYDWRKTEARINGLPNYTVKIEDQGFEFEIHFVALFSRKRDAVPLVLLHGWPGSFLEFLSALEILKGKYSAEELPYHVIVPSLPGYGYSNGPPLDRDFDCEGIARVVDKLMVGLGFGEGYVAQGGDVGSFVSRILAVSHEGCKAVHLNMVVGVGPTEDKPFESLTDAEKKGVARAQEFSFLGDAYAREHGTRPATIGLVLSSSPLALLAWVGEKFLQWSSPSPPLSEILDSLTLYWLTSTLPRSLYPYRQFCGPAAQFFHPSPEWYIKKPMGYSYNSRELAPTPKGWVEGTGRLVWFRGYGLGDGEEGGGGHFMAMERPERFVGDIEGFIGEVWPLVMKEEGGKGKM